LTDTGRAFLPEAKNLIAAETEARLAIRKVGGEETALLQVGWQRTLSSIATAAIESTLRMMPALRVEAAEDVSREICGKVEREEVELGVAYVPMEKDAYERELETEVLAANPLCFVSSAHHPLGRQEYVHLNSLANEPFALPWLKDKESHGSLLIRETIESYFLAHGFSAKRLIFQGSSIASVLAIVRSGLAVTVLATLDVADREGLAIRPLQPEPPAQAIGLIWRKDKPLSPAAEAFANHVRARVDATFNHRRSSSSPPGRT
jgi:LysR family cyn operon transcriptional activator